MSTLVSGGCSFVNKRRASFAETEEMIITNKYLLWNILCKTVCARSSVFKCPLKDRATRFTAASPCLHTQFVDVLVTMIVRRTDKNTRRPRVYACASQLYNIDVV